MKTFLIIILFSLLVQAQTNKIIRENDLDSILTIRLAVIGDSVSVSNLIEDSTSKYIKWENVRKYGVVADGVTDDTDSLQRALNTGRIIVGNPGDVYRVTSGLAITDTVKFIGGGAKIIYSDSTEALFSTASTIGLFELENLTIETNFDNFIDDQHYIIDVDAEKVNIKNCFLHGAQIHIGSATSGIIDNNVITDTNSVGSNNALYGVYLTDSYGVTVSNNTIYGFNSGIKMGVVNNTPTSTTEAGYVIMGNKISGSEDSHINVFDGGRRCVIAYNVLSDTANIGIQVKSNSSTPGPGGWANYGNSERILIQGNIITGVYSYGILLNGKYYQVHDNQVSGATVGILVGTLSSNVDAPYVGNISILNNLLMGNGSAIQVYAYKDQTIINNNTFIGTTIGDSLGTCIYVATGAQVAINNNQAQWFLYFLNSEPTDTLTYITAIGNSLKNGTFGFITLTPNDTAHVTLVGNLAKNVEVPIGTNPGTNWSNSYKSIQNSWDASVGFLPLTAGSGYPLGELYLDNPARIRLRGATGYQPNVSFQHGDDVYYMLNTAGNVFTINDIIGNGVQILSPAGNQRVLWDSSGNQTNDGFVKADSMDARTMNADSIFINGTKIDLATHFDTLSYNWGVMDTVLTGSLPGWKLANNITITEISAYTDANTVTFNIEERAETTPNTAGTDAMSSDLVADNNQQETTTFSNADFAKDTWMVPTISATGDVSIFSITIRYIKR